MRPFSVEDALARDGIVDLSSLGRNAGRTARRHGLVLVQGTAALAATQPVGPLQLMRAVVLTVAEPFALLSGAALWAHGQGGLPEKVEVGVPWTRGLSLEPPLMARRIAPATLAGAVVRRGLPVVSLEVAVVQAADRLRDEQALAMVEKVLRSRATTPERLRNACRRGLSGSRAVRAALVAVDGGDLEVQKRRLRRALEGAGVTGLRSEVRLVSRAGGSCYLDLLHDPSGKALELDGPYHDLPEQRRIDRRRDRWVRGARDRRAADRGRGGTPGPARRRQGAASTTCRVTPGDYCRIVSLHRMRSRQ